MDKYVISHQHEKEMVIENFPEDLDHIPVILNDELPSSEAYELVLDMLQSDSSVRVMMIGESHHLASVLSCEAQISSCLDIYSATFDTVSEVEHVWSSAVAGLERLQVLWVRRGVAVLLSRSALPAELPRLKSPKPRAKGERGGQSRGKFKKNYRGSQSSRAHEESRLQGSATGGCELQLGAQGRGRSSKAAVSSPRSEGPSSGTKSKIWTSSDKPSRSRGRGAREKNLGDFLLVSSLQSSNDVHKVKPVATTKPESKKVLNNNSKKSLEMVRSSREQVLPSNILSPEDMNLSTTRKPLSLTHAVFNNSASSSEEHNKTVGASNDSYGMTPSSKSVSDCDTEFQQQNCNQRSETQAGISNTINLETPLSIDYGDEGPKSTGSSVDLECLPANQSTSSRTYEKKGSSSDRKVSFHLPLVSQTAPEGSFSVDESSVKPKTGILGSPRNNLKRNNSKNRRKKSEEGRELNEFPNPVKNQGMSTKVC
ncbi:hypothetical protein FHG87_004721 [Trinorchestia longiramus]|nr:hypothetical protein FHG87_004721 [Trinorchestia longiramus]